MEITVFAKKRKTKDGRAFFSYLSTLKKKDGTDKTVSVKFREDAGSPDARSCPMNIIVDKQDANLVSKTRIREDTGEPTETLTLWVSKWEHGTPYVDKSLDDYDF